jgi:hypothetical protein
MTERCAEENTAEVREGNNRLGKNLKIQCINCISQLILLK